ncbi:DUF1961 family protein [Negadavirga shengliensis]|uniref:DUF1961 family protein n=1 Tax=Negadavirga shengliensis TaxID=1389218 RepID=A0ABV9SZ61_9BACT
MSYTNISYVITLLFFLVFPGNEPETGIKDLFHWRGQTVVVQQPLFPDQGTVVFRETFDYPDGPLPDDWWYEGNTARIKDGHLFVDADTSDQRMSTIWLDRELSGNIRIEFDVHVVSSSDTANNINCFFMYSDPEGKPLRETKDARVKGDYNSYHVLNGYIFTYLANGNPTNARIRFRDNPGFNLLAEGFGSECKAGKTYRIGIEKRNNRYLYWVDGMKILDKAAGEFYPTHSKGLFGFRTWHTSLWWDNVVIRQMD